MIIYYHKLLYVLPLALITGPFIPDLIVVLCSILFLIDTFRLKLFDYYNNNFFKVFIIFVFFLNLSALFSDYSISFKYSLGYIRYGIFTILLFYIFKNFPKFIYNLGVVFIFVFILLIIDGFIQYFFSYNIAQIKIEKYGTGLSYVTSFFGEEKKLGSFLSRLSPILFLSILLIKKKFNFEFSFLNTILILALFVIVLLTTERVSIFILSCFITILFLKSDKILKSKIIFLISLIFIIVLIYFTNTPLVEKIKSIFYSTGLLSPGYTEEGLIKGGYDEGIFIFSKFYHDQIRNSLDLFKENIFFGIGPKNYQYFMEPGWGHHPHNFHAQILSEIGIFGYFIFFCVFMYFLINCLKKIFLYKLDNVNNEIKLYLYLIILLNLAPIPSGNFFNNWLNIILYFPFGYLLFLNEKKI